MFFFVNDPVHWQQCSAYFQLASMNVKCFFSFHFFI
jgi:hypothetical protein